MDKLFYPRSMRSMIKKNPYLKYRFDLPLRISYSGQSNFEFEYIGEFEVKFKIALGYGRKA
jgi:hypothetical protein